MITEVVRKRVAPPPEEDRMIDLYMSVRFTINRTDYTADERKAVSEQFLSLLELLKHPALDRKLAQEMFAATQSLLTMWMHNSVLLDCVHAIEEATEVGTLTVPLLVQVHQLLNKTRDEYRMPYQDVERIIARLERCAKRAQLVFVRGRHIPVT